MKLVRNSIPEIAEANGDRLQFRKVVDVDEHARLLDDKLREELGEWLDGNDPTELADVLQALHDAAVVRGIGWDNLVALADAKRDERGGFLDGVVLIGPAPEPAADPEPDRVVDLMDALIESVRRAKEARTRHPQPRKRTEP